MYGASIQHFLMTQTSNLNFVKRKPKISQNFLDIVKTYKIGAFWHTFLRDICVRNCSKLVIVM